MEGINTTKRNTSNIDQPVTYERIIDNFIDFCLLYLVLKRFMITRNLVVKIQNLVINYKS